MIVKLYLKKKLHAKLYLVHYAAMDSMGFLGSSNLTQSGLSSQEELNIEVLDKDTCNKLQDWFNKRWEDSDCIDISEEMAQVVQTIVDERENHLTQDTALTVQVPISTTATASSREQKKKQASSVGVDYSQLRDLLVTKDWKNANRETGLIMLKIADKEKEKYLDRQSIEEFPCSELRLINQLWLEASEERYGFSVQKQIWQKTKDGNAGYCGSSDGYSSDDFCSRLGWKWMNSSDFHYIDEYEQIISEHVKYKLTYNPYCEGHLPSLRIKAIFDAGKSKQSWSYVLGIGKNWGGGIFYYWEQSGYYDKFPPILDCFFSRVETCKL